MTVTAPADDLRMFEAEFRWVWTPRVVIGRGFIRVQPRYLIARLRKGGHVIGPVRIPPRYVRVRRSGNWARGVERLVYEWLDTAAMDDDEFAALPEQARVWRPANGRERVEDIRWMVDHGEGSAGVCERLTRVLGEPVTWESLERFLQRHGARDLIARLKGTPPRPVVSGDDLRPGYRELRQRARRESKARTKARRVAA